MVHYGPSIIIIIQVHFQVQRLYAISVREFKSVFRKIIQNYLETSCIFWLFALLVIASITNLVITYWIIRSIKNAGKNAAEQAETTTEYQNCGAANATQQEIQMPILRQYPSHSQSSQYNPQRIGHQHAESVIKI